MLRRDAIEELRESEDRFTLVPSLRIEVETVSFS